MENLEQEKKVALKWQETILNAQEKMENLLNWIEDKYIEKKNKIKKHK